MAANFLFREKMVANIFLFFSRRRVRLKPSPTSISHLLTRVNSATDIFGLSKGTTKKR
jgi:hypothetical protein